MTPEIGLGLALAAVLVLLIGQVRLRRRLHRAEIALELQQGARQLADIERGELQEQLRHCQRVRRILANENGELRQQLAGLVRP